MAHSAYPELGESAIDKLVEALHRLHAMKLPVDAEVGPCTKNVGSIQGGRAPNVISDFAKADLFYRLVGPADALRREIAEAVGELAEVRFTRETPCVRLRTLDGLPTMVAAFTTDIPSLANWGEPLLLGPGSIHVAHTLEERGVLRFGVAQLQPGDAQAALHFPNDGVFHQVAVICHGVLILRGVMPSTKRLEAFVGAREIGFGLFHHASQRLKCFALRVHHLPHAWIKRRTA